MAKKLGLGCLGLIVLLVIIAAFGSAGNKGTAVPGSPAAAAVSTVAAEPTGSAPAVAGSAATVAKATPTAVPPKATATVQVGTRQSPVLLGSAWQFNKGGQVYKVGVSSVILRASGRVKEANMFNADPPAGNDYVLIGLSLEYVSGSQDKAFTTPAGGHRLYADNRFWGAPAGGVAPEPQFQGQDVFPGAKLTGWLAAKYLPTELMDQAVLVYDDVYFALK